MNPTTTIAVLLVAAAASPALAMHPHVVRPARVSGVALSDAFMADVVSLAMGSSPPAGGPPKGVARCCVTGDTSCIDDVNHCSVGCVDGTLSGDQCKNCQCYTAGKGCCPENYFCDGTVGVIGNGKCKAYCAVDPTTGKSCYGNGVCSSTPGKCTCNAGFDPASSCKTCLPGHFGKNCDACPGVLSSGSECFGHGKCDGSATRSGTGKCTCAAGWATSDCSACAEGMGPPGKCTDPTCAVPCGPHGKCTAPNTCTCDAGWGPSGNPFNVASVSLAAATMCNEPVCEHGCGGDNGKCTAPNTCACASGWSGADCTTPVCGTSGCGPNGECSAPNKCVCKKGWTGENCDQAICDAPKCGPQGTCTGPNTCTCKKGYGGADCTQPICADGCGQGACTAPGVCSCAEGWQGDHCNIPVCEKVQGKECGGHGTCQHPGVCKCIKGWQGDSCSQAICGSKVCVHGSCGAPGQCACEEGWTGDTCETAICSGLQGCTSNCCSSKEGRGSCTAPDTCTCTKDWTGVTCTLPVCDKSCTEGGSGECIAPGQCKCQYGYSGPNCQDALPYWGTKDDGLTHVIVFAISAAFVLLLPTATVCWCRHRTGTGRACCNKNQQPQREGLLRPMLSIGSKTPTTDASATSESRRAWGVKWMTLAMLASVVELAGYSLAIMRIVCDNQDGVSGEAECFTWKSFLRQWKDVFTSGDGLNLKPQTLSDIGIILVTRLLVFRLLLPALSLCGRRPCRCNRRCMGHYTRLRVTEWLVVTFDVMATALAGAKLYLYKIELGDTLGNLKATVIVAFVTTCVMHVVVHSLALILESPQPQIVDALAVGATATTRKTADRGGPGPKTHTNDDGAPIRANNDSGLFESDSSNSSNRVEAMFIDIMSSRHRYNPPKEPGQPAAKEGAGAEADEEETDVLPDIPASKNEDTAFRQESLEQKLERLSVSLGKGQMRKQEEDPAQRVESLYSTF